MTRHPAAPFPDRLALARRMVARGASRPPTCLADQLDAAVREVRVLHERLGATLPLVDPGRNWRQRADLDPSDEVRSYLLAALLGCTAAVCIHLRRGGPQPAVCRLAMRRADCARCAATIRRPPAEDDDRCDVCERREVVTFVPFAVRQGPSMLVGDACPDCAGVLGIGQEAAS